MRGVSSSSQRRTNLLCMRRASDPYKHSRPVIKLINPPAFFPPFRLVFVFPQQQLFSGKPQQSGEEHAVRVVGGERGVLLARVPRRPDAAVDEAVRLPQREHPGHRLEPVSASRDDDRVLL